MNDTIDILMLTCKRPHYTALSLPALLDSCDETMRVWLWQNGTDEETVAEVQKHLDHPRLHRFHHSRTNEMLTKPINWFFKESDGGYVSIIADDCLVQNGWSQRLREAHKAVPSFGVIACWHFMPEDFDPALAQRKTCTFECGQQLLVNPWVQGAGVLVKRECLDRVGYLRRKEPGLTSLWMRIAAAGWVNGWHLPLIPIDHMDDPRSPHSAVASDEGLNANLPLSAGLRGTNTVESWIEHLQRSARIVQEAPMDPKLYFGWRKKIRRLRTRLAGCEPVY